MPSGVIFLLLLEKCGTCKELPTIFIFNRRIYFCVPDVFRLVTRQHFDKFTVNFIFVTNFYRIEYKQWVWLDCLFFDALVRVMIHILKPNNRMNHCELVNEFLCALDDKSLSSTSFRSMFALDSMNSNIKWTGTPRISCLIPNNKIKLSKGKCFVFVHSNIGSANVCG